MATSAMYGLMIQISLEDHKIKDSNQNITIISDQTVTSLCFHTYQCVIITNFSVAKR